MHTCVVLLLLEGSWWKETPAAWGRLTSSVLLRGKGVAFWPQLLLQDLVIGLGCVCHGELPSLGSPGEDNECTFLALRNSALLPGSRC